MLCVASSVSDDSASSKATSKRPSKTAPAAAPAADADDDLFDDQQNQKFGIGGINRPIDKMHNKYYGYCPLHLAASKGFIVSQLFNCYFFQVSIVIIVILIISCLTSALIT